MNTFPMIRSRLSNEHIMAGVFLVLVLYHLPFWLEAPAGILKFILIVGFGLSIDAVAGFLRYKRIWCCVSGGVTAAMISLLAYGVPLWGQLLGVAFGLVFGKHIQGGTGKNVSNPAMAGMAVILLLFDLPDILLPSSPLLIPAILLGLLFLYYRPYSGISLILGMLLSMYLNQELTIANVMSYGVFFWGCLVMTDPVTITANKLYGTLMGFTASFTAIGLYQSPVAMIVAILLINVISSSVVEVFDKPNREEKPRIRIPKVFRQEALEMIDLTNEKVRLAEGKNNSIEKAASITKSKDHTIDQITSTKENTALEESLSSDIILERIRRHEVYGMGGAAFPTYRKLETLMGADAKNKYLIINAVECDPGLIHDQWLLQHHSDEIYKGAKLLNTCIQFSEVYLALKHIEQPREMNQETKLEKLTGSKQWKIVRVKDRYPVGAEKLLIKEVLGRKLSRQQIPAACGILVLNVQTVYAIGEAVQKNVAMDTRYLTVADLNTGMAKVVRVRLGMKLQEIMEAISPGTINIYAGGGIMQAYLAEEESVVDRNMNFIAAGRMPKFKESPQCSRCGLCSRSCPSGLKVREIADLADKGKPEEALKLNAEECISCASCSYICPAGRNLSARVASVKQLSLS